MAAAHNTKGRARCHDLETHVLINTPKILIHESSKKLMATYLRGIKDVSLVNFLSRGKIL